WFVKDHARTKEITNLESIYIDTRVFEWVCNNPSGEKNWDFITKILKDVLTQIAMCKKSELFKKIDFGQSSLTERKHPLFFDVNKSCIEELLEAPSDKKSHEVIPLLADLLKLETWLFNFGK